MTCCHKIESTTVLSFLGTAMAGIYLLRRNLHSIQSTISDGNSIPENDTHVHPTHKSNLPTLPSPTQTLALIQQRRSVFTKQFTGRSIPRKIVEDMLESARWAPNHHVTEPWRFVVFESEEGRDGLGNLLAELYKKGCAPENSDGEDNTSKKKPFLQAKYDKKRKGATLSSHIIAICISTNNPKSKNPIMEEVCSVAMAVQNMHLIASAYGVGAYWSSGGVYSSSEDLESIGSVESTMGVFNPKELTDFLRSTMPEERKEELVCLGWLYIGDYYGDFHHREEGSSGNSSKKWPSGRRGTIDDKVSWR
mmetsp:Transcript_5665/g.11793  ORF Transcript_5665/g.11793 Transcript_5665/m.11793 type:complete len:307 (+) Transcript_5665:155-1075(+)